MDIQSFTSGRRQLGLNQSAGGAKAIGQRGCEGWMTCATCLSRAVVSSGKSELEGVSNDGGAQEKRRSREHDVYDDDERWM